jgi:hypothetical protein
MAEWSDGPEPEKHIGNADILVCKGVISEANVEQIREIMEFCKALLSVRE